MAGWEAGRTGPGERLQVGDVAKAMGGDWEDVEPLVVQADRAVMREAAQKAVAEGEERVFSEPLVR